MACGEKRLAVGAACGATEACAAGLRCFKGACVSEAVAAGVEAYEGIMALCDEVAELRRREDAGAIVIGPGEGIDDEGIQARIEAAYDEGEGTEGPSDPGEVEDPGPRIKALQAEANRRALELCGEDAYIRSYVEEVHKAQSKTFTRLSERTIRICHPEIYNAVHHRMLSGR